MRERLTKLPVGWMLERCFAPFARWDRTPLGTPRVPVAVQGLARAFAGYQVNAALMGGAAAGAIFLHCLPAHRGEEVAAEVIDGPQSRVWDEAENRLHVQKALMAGLMGGEPLA